MLGLRGQQFQIVVVGGSALLAGGWVDRPTVDVDVVALAEPAGLVKARPLPRALEAAIADVAAARGLPATWMNPGPTDLVDWGLPQGLLQRARREEYAALTVFFADRLDLVCTKLFAVADLGPTGRHIDDLRALEPTIAELQFGASWCRHQDPSPAFRASLVDALAAFNASEVDADG